MSLIPSPLNCKEIQLVHPKGNQSWIFIGRADAEAETPILWPLDVNSQLIGKDPDSGNDWRWEEGEGRGWDGWMISLTRWTWVWVSSRSWWWAGKPGVLQSVGSQRVRHDWVTKLNWLISLTAVILIDFFICGSVYCYLRAYEGTDHVWVIPSCSAPVRHTVGTQYWRGVSSPLPSVGLA